MTLPLERFLMLIEIVQERHKEESRADLAQASFIAWQIAQHQYRAMFTHVGFSVSKENENAFRNSQQKFWDEFPNFDKYLRNFGVIDDE